MAARGTFSRTLTLDGTDIMGTRRRKRGHNQIALPNESTDVGEATAALKRGRRATADGPSRIDNVKRRFDSPQTIVAALGRKLRRSAFSRTESAKVETSNSSMEPADRPRSKWRRYLVCGGVAIVLSALVAPRIVFRPSILNRLVRSTVPGLRGDIRIGGASAGWLSPVSLRDITVVDENSQPLVAIQKLETSGSLLRLASRPSDIGRIDVIGPHVHIQLRPDGSNLEDLVSSLATKNESDTEFSGDSSGGSMGVEIFLSGGTIDIDNSSKRWSVGSLDGRLKSERDITRPIRAELSGELIGPSTGSKVSVQLAWTQPTTKVENDLGRGTAKLSADSLPLNLAELIGERCGQHFTASGHLQTDLTCSWEGRSSEPIVSLDGSLHLTQVHIQHPGLLGSDVINIDQVESALNISLQDQLLTLTNVTFNSDFCAVMATGSAQLGDGWLAGSIDLPPAPHGSGYRLKGDIDLASLTRMLPATLNLRADTQLNSGQVIFDIASQPLASGSALSGTVATSAIAGVHGHREVRWDEPVELSFEVRRGDRNMLVDHLRCNSQFLQASASEADGEGQLFAVGDLNGIMSELEKFIDMDGISLAGQLRLDGSWQRQQTGEVRAESRLVLQQFALMTPNYPPWHEQQLSIELSVDGHAIQTEQLRVNRATLRLVSDSDRLDASLREQIAVTRDAPQIPLQFRIQGSVENWLARIAPWCDLSGWEAAGDINSQGLVDLSLEQVRLSQTVVDVDNLVVRGSGVQISEPKVRIETSAAWNQLTQEVTSDNTTFASSALAFRADNLRLGVAEGTGEGQIGFRGDVARLSRWFSAADQSSGYRSSGSMLGRVTLAQQGDMTTFSGTLDVEPFDLFASIPPEELVAGGQRWQPLWHEGHVRMEGSGHYKAVGDILMVDQLDVVSDGFRVRTKGELSELLGGMFANVDGQANYDLAVLSEKLRPLLGNDILIAGRQAESFSVRGPLTSVTPSTHNEQATPPSEMKLASARLSKPSEAALWLESGFGWQSAKIYGMSIGPNRFQVRLANGMLESSRWDLQVGEGRLTLAPLVNLNGQPTLILDRGTALDQLRLTPELCSTWLKFVAPLLADSTEVDGTFSIALDEASFPLYNPQSGSASGVMTVHSAQLTPGPLARQFLSIAQQVSSLVDRNSARRLNPDRTWVEVGEQQIGFQMENGRVHHHGLEVHIDDIIVRTQGWVSTDQSLSLMAEVPILDQWVEKEKLLAGLRGQSIQIPITGTLTSPNLDERALRQVSSKLIGSAAKGFLENEVQNQLQKLFRSK